MEAILARLLEPDNEIIKAATEELRAAFKQPGVIPELCTVLGTSHQVQIRQYAAVLLRKKFSKPGSWFKFSQPDRNQLKSGCLSSLVAEQEKSVRNALAQLIGTLAKHELGQRGGGWPELLQLILGKVGSEVGQERVLGVMLVAVLGEVAGEQISPQLKDFLQMFRKTLGDPEVEVCYYTIVALTHLVRRTGSEEVVMFQQLVPAVLAKVEAIAGVDQDKAVTAIDIFDELIESEVAIVVPHIKPMVELCIKLAQDQEMNDSLRIKAVTFLGRLTRLKKKTIVKHKLYIPMIQVIFTIMAQQELPDEDDDEDEDDDDSPALAASQSLDILALNLPPEKYITALLGQVQPALSSPSPAHQRAAYQAIAVSAEGCQEHIRTKYLQSFLQIMGAGIRHQLPVVRNSALYMLGQFSEFIQPEISNHAPDILPVLLEYLDHALASITPGGKDPSTVSRIFYALETFCENLEMKLIPHLELIMSRATQAMADPFSVRIQELAISLVGAASNATKGAIVPYMGVVVPRLEHYLTMQHTDDTQVLLTQAMATLGTLARAVGEQHFSKEFAEKCINIGLELVKTNDDPDVRKCAYALFGAVASVVKVEMGTELVGMLVDLMLKSIQNTEGISLDVEENDTNIPLEDLSDEEDIESNADDTDKALDDLEGVKNVTVENAYMAEKECAIIALKDLSVECGAAFHPFLALSVEEVASLLEYPDYDVRCAAIEASAFFLIAYHKAGTQECGQAKFREGVVGFLTRLVELVVEEEEHQVVIAALDAMTELLKQCKTAVTEGAGHCEKIVSCIQKIMKGECASQDMEAEEGGEDEECEQDEMLFEYAGEVLPNLGRALTPQAFAPYFTGLLPILLKKTKKQCSVAERSFAIGAIADSIEPLAGVIDPFLPHLLPIFVEMTRDAEDDCRNNAVYGLGEVILWGGAVVEQHYTAVLGTLSNLLQVETSPRVVDQIVGAVARAVVANIAKVPVEEMVTAVLANLPLKEDMDEYDMVFKFFSTLFTAQHPTFTTCLPKIVECAAVFFTSPATDKEKTSPQVISLLKQISSSFGAELQGLVAALPPDQGQVVMKVIQE